MKMIYLGLAHIQVKKRFQLTLIDPEDEQQNRIPITLQPSRYEALILIPESAQGLPLEERPFHEYAVIKTDPDGVWRGLTISGWQRLAVANPKAIEIERESKHTLAR